MQFEGIGQICIKDVFPIMEEIVEYPVDLQYYDRECDEFVQIGRLLLTGMLRPLTNLKNSLYDLSSRLMAPGSTIKKDIRKTPVVDWNRPIELVLTAFSTTNAHIVNINSSDSVVSDVLSGYKFCLELKMGSERKRSPFFGGRARYRGKEKIATVVFNGPGIKVNTTPIEVKRDSMQLILHVQGSDVGDVVIGRVIQPLELMMTKPGEDFVERDFSATLRDITNKIVGKVTFTMIIRPREESLVENFVEEVFLDDKYHVERNLSCVPTLMEFGWVRITRVEAMRLDTLRLLGLHARMLATCADPSNQPIVSQVRFSLLTLLLI
jgi:hypothetical protein